MEKMRIIVAFCVLAKLSAAGPALAGAPSDALEQCLMRNDRATAAALAQPPEDIAALLPVLGGQDSGCIGTALSACTINRLGASGCLDDVTRQLQLRLSQAIAGHPVEEDRPVGLRSAYDHWLSAPPPPCDPQLAGGVSVCTALELGGRLIEARGWGRRFAFEALD